MDFQVTSREMDGRGDKVTQNTEMSGTHAIKITEKHMD